MVEIKVQCDCGQRFKFDVEPVDGRMPFTVNCPICGADGTEKANILLQRKEVTYLVRSTAAPAAAPPPPPARAVKVRVNAPTTPPPPPPTAEVAQAVAPPPPPPPPRPAAGRARSKAPTSVAEPGRKGSFGLGVLGGLLGALLGSLIYFAVFNYADLSFRLLAVAVGFLGGLGARLMGRDGSNELGVITATFVLAGIFAAQYVTAKIWWQREISGGMVDTSYEAIVGRAKDAVKAVPTGSDEEIRIYLAKEAADEDGKPEPEAVSDEDIKAFREDSLPVMRDLASGKITKEQYDTEHVAEAKKEKADRDSDESTFKAFFIIMLLNKLNIVSMCVAAGLAYKMSIDA